MNNSQTINVYCASSADHTYANGCCSYNTWTASDYILPGVEHTISVSVKDNSLNLRILGGVKELNKTLVPNSSDGVTYLKHWNEHVPASGDFVVWSGYEEGRVVSYEMPVNTRDTNPIVTTETAGTITLENHSWPDTGLPYLVVDGEHTTQKLRVKATFDKALGESFFIGMRMNGNSPNRYAHDGIVFQLSNWGIACYCTGGTCYATNFGSKSLTINQANKEYIFEVWMKDSTIYMDVYRAGVKTSFSWDVSTFAEGAHAGHIPTSGDFMVWSCNDKQTFQYEVIETE